MTTKNEKIKLIENEKKDKIKTLFCKYFAIPKNFEFTDTMFIELANVAFHYDFFAWQKYFIDTNDIRYIAMATLNDLFTKEYFRVFHTLKEQIQKQTNYDDYFLVKKYNEIRKILNLKSKKFEEIEKVTKLVINECYVSFE